MNSGAKSGAGGYRVAFARGDSRYGTPQAVCTIDVPRAASLDERRALERGALALAYRIVAGMIETTPGAAMPEIACSERVAIVVSCDTDEQVAYALAGLRHGHATECGQ